MLNSDLKILAVHEDVMQRIHQLRDDLLHITLTPGPQGEKGDDGRDGVDGKNGKPGLNGKDGVDGKDGRDGEDGVSVTDVRLDLDGHLVLELSNGDEVDAGSIEPFVKGEGDQHFHVSMGGGGSSDKLDGYLDLNDKGMVARFDTAESLTAGDVCHIDDSGLMAKAQAVAEAKADGLVGLCLRDVGAGAKGTFLLRGFYDMGTFPAGAQLYIGLNAGEVTEVRPSAAAIVRVLGYAINSTQIFFDPDKTWIEVT